VFLGLDRISRREASGRFASQNEMWGTRPAWVEYRTEASTWHSDCLVRDFAVAGLVVFDLEF